MLTILVLPAALAAGPSQAQIESASFQQVGRSKHDETGTITIDKARVAEVDCFRGSTIAQGVSPDALLEAALDVVGAVEWSSAGLAEGRVLSRTGDRMAYYQYLDVPGWTMASDRFWVLHGRIRRQGAARSFTWDRLLDEAGNAVRAKVKKAHPGAVEPPVNVGAWHFAPEGEGVGIRYVICSDTGGSMPRMLQNAATRRALPDTIGDVVRQARRLGS